MPRKYISLCIRQTHKNVERWPRSMQLILLAFRVKEDLVGDKTER